LYGIPKSGKTTLASHFYVDKKPPAFIMTEDGEGDLPLMKKRVSSWESFAKLVKWAEDNREGLKAEHSCFVIDLISDLDAMCTQHLCDEQNVQSLGDLPHGQGWAYKKAEF